MKSTLRILEYIQTVSPLISLVHFRKWLYFKIVNHSVWFEYGNFHTNNVEGLWSQIKRITNNFIRIIINSIEKSYQANNEKRNYLDSWICYALYLRETEKAKLSRKGKINLLIKYIKI